jgi:hypothetical protein
MGPTGCILSFFIIAHREDGLGLVVQHTVTSVCGRDFVSLRTISYMFSSPNKTKKRKDKEKREEIVDTVENGAQRVERSTHSR